jgi:hypothetical protein
MTPSQEVVTWLASGYGVGLAVYLFILLTSRNKEN